MDSAVVNTLGLCCGIGMLDEGVRLGLEFFGLRSRAACYCEWESYASACLLARMEDASMEPSPVWCGDLADFDGQAFHGLVDLLCAGFPCQPWSCAGKQAGTADDRWLWPGIANIIRDVGPSIVFLENVPGLVSGGGLDHVLSDLAEMRFDAEWTSLTAEAVGASHRRERIFLLGYSRGAAGEWNARRFSAAQAGIGGEGIDDGYLRERSEYAGVAVDDATSPRHAQAKRRPNERQAGQSGGERLLSDGRGAVGIARRNGRRISQPRRGPNRRTVIGGPGSDLANASSSRPQERRSERGNAVEECSAIERNCFDVFAPGPSADWRSIPKALWPAVESRFRELASGQSLVVDESRTDQLRCAGNQVVALQAATALVELMRRAFEL